MSKFNKLEDLIKYCESLKSIVVEKRILVKNISILINEHKNNINNFRIMLKKLNANKNKSSIDRANIRSKNIEYTNMYTKLRKLKKDYGIANNIYVSTNRKLNKCVVSNRTQFIGQIIYTEEDNVSTQCNDINKNTILLSKLIDLNEINKIEKINLFKIETNTRKAQCKINKKNLFPYLQFRDRCDPRQHILQTKKLRSEMQFNKCNNSTELITQIRNILIDILTEINKETHSYDSELNFIDLFYILSKRVTNSNLSIVQINQHLKDNNIAYVTEQAINNKRTLISYEYFKIMYEHLLKHINSAISNTKTKSCINKKVSSSDGTTINFLKKLCGQKIKSDTFTLDKSGNFCKVLLNCVYEMTTETATDVVVTGNMSESQALTSQMNNMEKGSVIMGDGHYFTDLVIKKLKEKEMFGVFKVPNGFDICKKFLATGTQNCMSQYGNVPIRLIKYNYNNSKDDNNFYVLGTNLDETEYPDEFIENLYKMRWFIEEFFKILKCNCNLGNIKSYSYNHIMQEIYVQLIITLISKYTEIIGTSIVGIHKNNPNKKSHMRNVIYSISNNFLLKLFYCEQNATYIPTLERLIFDLVNTTNNINDNQHKIRHKNLPPIGYINKVNYAKPFKEEFKEEIKEEFKEIIK
jgi:hypothetical protein